MSTRRLRLSGSAAEPTEPTVRLAFASSDRRHVDGHFGTANAFALVAVAATHATLAEVVRLDTAAASGGDRLSERLTALRGCSAVYFQAAGAAAIRRLRESRIQPCKVAAGSSIRELVAAAQHSIVAADCPWLVRAMAHSGPSRSQRFDRMEQEGWTE